MRTGKLKLRSWGAGMGLLVALVSSMTVEAQLVVLQNESNWVFDYSGPGTNVNFDIEWSDLGPVVIDVPKSGGLTFQGSHGNSTGSCWDGFVVELIGDAVWADRTTDRVLPESGFISTGLDGKRRKVSFPFSIADPGFLQLGDPNDGGGNEGDWVIDAGSSFQIRLHPTFDSTHNPNGWIQSSAWNFLSPLLNPYGANPGEELMKTNWIAPIEVSDPDFNPRANQFHGGALPEIDFGAATGGGFDQGGLALQPTWVTEASLNSALPSLNLISSDLVDYRNITDQINSTTGEALPTDNVLAMATTYVENITGTPLDVTVCTASDDAIQVWVNNRCVTNVTAARVSSEYCQERTPIILPVGVSKIATLVWQGDGGWNFRLALEKDGTKLTDCNEYVRFLGPGTVEDGLSGQEQFKVTLSTTDPSPFDCPRPDDGIDVTLTGEGPGADSDLLTVIQKVHRPDGPLLEISDEPPGAEVRPHLSVVSSTSGFVTDFLILGPISNPGGAAPGAHFIRDVQIRSTTDESLDESDPEYRPAVGDDVPDNVLSVIATPGAPGINPNGVLTWNRVAYLRTLDFNEHYYSSQLDNNMVAVGFYMCLDEDKDVLFGVGSDDSFALRVDGALVGFRNVPRICGPDDTVQDYVGPVTLSAGNHFVLYKVYNGTGGHCGRIGVFNLDGTSVSNTEVTYGTSKDNCSEGFQHGWDIEYSVTRGELRRGVSLRVNSSVPTTVELSAAVLGEVKSAEGARRIEFSSEIAGTGPIGDFATSHDIGSPQNPGETLYDASRESYTLTSAGSDIWNNGDEFQFAYRVVEGDFDMRAHVASRFDAPTESRWGRYGLMARWTCDPTSKYSMAFGANGATIDVPRHQHRVTHLEGGPNRDSYLVDDGTFPAEGREPSWMRLVRRGNAIYSYMSEDAGGAPKKWCLVGSDHHGRNMPRTILAGLAVGGHETFNGESNVVEFDSFSLDALGAVTPLGPSDPVPILGPLGFQKASDAGVVVSNGTAFTPGVTGDRLRLTDLETAHQASAVWYGIPASGNAALLEVGFVAEFDVYMTPGSSNLPADGMTFAVVATGEEDLLGSAFGAFPPGLGVESLLGAAGDALGYGGLTSALRARTECHPSFAVEFDNWVGGGEPATDPEDGGSPDHPGNWHIGLDVNASVSSLVTNVDFGVPTEELPDISSYGVHVEVEYQPTGRIDAWVVANVGPVARTHVLSTTIPPLPSGDVVLGFTAGTGGATARQEVDNFTVSLRELSGLQLPGDCNQNGILDGNDTQCLYDLLFAGREPPCGGSVHEPGNLELFDADGSGHVDVVDWIYMTLHLTEGGPPHVLGEECVRIVGCGGSTCASDRDGDGLTDVVDVRADEAMDCSSFDCENGAFSDALSGGVTEGLVEQAFPPLSVLDELPNPDRGVRVIALGGAVNRLRLPSGGFLRNGIPQTGGSYLFSVPANFVLTRTNSAALEVDEGTVDVEFEALGLTVTVAAEESVVIDETSFTEVDITASVGSVLTLEESGATVTPEEGGSTIKISRPSETEPVELTVVTGMITVEVGGETFPLAQGDEFVPADTDGDGVLNDDDECSLSNLSPTIVIDGCDSGVANALFEDGCTISDLIAACAANATNHGEFVSCVSALTNTLKTAGVITGDEKEIIMSCAAEADEP